MLLGLDDESVRDLAAALNETAPRLSVGALAGSLAARFPRLPTAGLEQLLASLDSLHVLRAGRELSAAEVAEQISDAIEQHRAGTLRFDGTSRSEFENRLKVLLDVSTAQRDWLADEIVIRHRPARLATLDAPVPTGLTAWWIAVDSIRATPTLKESVLESVVTSMAFEGLEIEEPTARRLLDEALAGPPLVHPDDE